MAKVFGDIPELMGVMMLRYCPLLPPRPHSTSSQNHFPHRPMGSDGYSARYNGHFTAERERLCSGIMGPRREVALLWVRIWFVQSAYLRNALSCHRYGTLFAHRHWGRVWEWPPFIPQNPHVERSQQPRTQVEPAGSNNYPAPFSLP